MYTIVERQGIAVLFEVGYIVHRNWKDYFHNTYQTNCHLRFNSQRIHPRDTIFLRIEMDANGHLKHF
jgi:hypothetical protein